MQKEPNALKFEFIYKVTRAVTILLTLYNIYIHREKYILTSQAAQKFQETK